MRANTLRGMYKTVHLLFKSSVIYASQLHPILAAIKGCLRGVQLTLFNVAKDF